MGVYIPKIEMPSKCGECFLRIGECKQRIYMEKRPPHCPLIELPPHGDLIEKQDVLNILMWRNAAWDGYDNVMKLPTIIESEGD